MSILSVIKSKTKPNPNPNPKPNPNPTLRHPFYNTKACIHVRKHPRDGGGFAEGL